MNGMRERFEFEKQKFKETGRKFDQIESKLFPNRKRSTSTAGPFKTLGEQMQAVARAEVSRGQEIDQRLLEVRATGASESIPSEGGFLVQQDFSAELLRMAFETGVVAARTRRIHAGSIADPRPGNRHRDARRVPGTRRRERGFGIELHPRHD